MKNIFKTVAAFAAVVLAGCTTDFNEEIVAPQGGKTTVTIGLPESRTTLGELVEGKRKVYWTDGDMIVINGVTSAPTEINEENAGVATFEFDAVLTHPYSVFYPAELWKNNSTITLPAVQTYTAGSFAEDSAPMACYTEGAAPTLHHLAAVVRLSVKNSAEEGADNHNINRIEFRGNNGEQVSGDFSIDYATTALTGVSTAEADKVVAASYRRNLGEGVVDFFVVVPAREYANGFTVRVIDELGHYMDLKSGAVTLAKGEIKAMPEFAFAPTGTTVDTEIAIASAADWNAFAKAHNEGTYEGQILSVKITSDLVFDDDTNDGFVSIEEFSGVIDGGNKAFKNLKANDALFGTLTYAEVKDLILDSSSSFLFENIVFGDNLYAASLALNTYNSTSLTNCINKANVIVSGCTTPEAASPVMHVGGLVARTDATSTLTSCQNFGKVETTNTNSVKLVAQIGEMRHGGLVGYNRGLIEACVNEGEVISAFNVGRKGVGGIIGRGTGTGVVKGCTNKGTITEASTRAGAGVNDHNRWVHVGGIAGMIAGSMTNNTNEGAISSTTNVKILHIGGILGRVNGDNSVVMTGNSNKGVIIHNGESRQTYIGGLIGSSDGNRIPELDLNGGVFSGSITVGNLEKSASQTLVCVGGVIGRYDNTTAPLVVKNATVTGNITLENIKDTSLFKSGQLGGVVGYAHALTISDCNANGDVAITVNRSKSGSSPIWIGGVVGGIMSGNSSITNCHATKLVKTWNYNNFPFFGMASDVVSTYTANLTAGILGGYGYDKSIEAGTIAISNCSFSGDLVNYRGMGAGIAGYIVNGTVSNCSVPGDLYADSAHQYNYVGGIVGGAENSNISDSWCKSTITVKSGGSMWAHAGGVAAFLIYNSSIKNCAYYGNISVGTSGTNEYCGGIVGEVVNDTANSPVVVENCKLGGKVKGTALTADNVANYVLGVNSTTGTNGTATVSGTTLWDGTVTE